MRKRLSALLVLLLGVGSLAYADGKSSSDFIRYKVDETPESGLQIAVTDYVSSDSKSVITLYGVVHIADADYYKTVQKDLDGFDAVLYEGVKSGTTPNQETKVLNTVQGLMGTALGLTFQKDGINYTRKNLVHADISMDQLEESLNGESIVPFGQYVKNDQLEWLKPVLEVGKSILTELMKQYPDWQNSIKAQFGQQLSETDINTQLSPKMHQAIVLDRNRIVINVLQEQFKKTPEKKTYAIFYGAAHMPDLESRLEKMGFKEKSKRWMTAWKIKPVAEATDDEDK